MLETELFLPFNLENDEPLILENEFFGEGGAVLNGSAINSHLLSGSVSGGIIASGNSSIFVIYNLEIDSFGVLLIGEAINGKTFFYYPDNGVICSGRTIIKTGRSPKLIPRFNIGDSIYVPSRVGNYYLLQKIRDRFINNKKPFYYDGLGWYSDDVVFSFEQYQEWLCVTDFGDIEEERKQLINNACS